MEDMEYMEEKHNKAFAFLIISFTQHMKSKGASDEEIKSFMNSFVLGLVNTIQDYKNFGRNVESIIEASAASKSIDPMRMAGIKCEILDQIEDAVGKKINEILGYDNVINFTEEKLRKEYGIEMNDITFHLLDSIRKGEF